LNGQRTKCLLTATAVLAGIAAGAWLAVPAAGAGPPPLTATIVIKTAAHGPRFQVPSDGIAAGGSLTISDQTGGQFGAHTFSLVKASVLPSKAQQKTCKKKGHICQEIKKRWHAHTEDLDVGAPGWDREGDLKRKGDSSVLAADSKTRLVSAKAGTTLHFMCALHPEMQGKLKVG
jgi:hypothetical protein